MDLAPKTHNAPNSQVSAQHDRSGSPREVGGSGVAKDRSTSGVKTGSGTLIFLALSPTRNHRIFRRLLQISQRIRCGERIRVEHASAT